MAPQDVTTTSIHLGIVGHRPRRLARANPAILRRVLRGILRDIRQEAARAGGASGPIGLTVISPLAEGADRLFAELAFEVGCALHCVMPFSQVEYERDFVGAQASEPQSLQQFRRLLARFAAAGRLRVTELSGEGRHREQAYRAAGARVVQASDLLVAVWDGEQRGSQAGTAGAVALARERSLPTVWVHAVAPHPWCLLDAGEDTTPADDEARQHDLRRVTRRVLGA